MDTKKQENAPQPVIELDDRIIFKVFRQPDDKLSVVFYDLHGMPLGKFKNKTVKEIDDCVFNFYPKCEKIQILTYPNDEWFKDGCPETRFARKIECPLNG